MLNEHHTSPLILSGTDNGIVRIWRGVYSQARHSSSNFLFQSIRE
jgi:hypothetical protein